MTRKQIVARWLSLLIFSSAIGTYIARDVARKHTMGKAAYLSYHANFFDKHLSAAPHLVTKIIVYTFFIALSMAVYELIAYVILKISFAVLAHSEPERG